jgi:hypothetical protein
MASTITTTPSATNSGTVGLLLDPSLEVRTPEPNMTAHAETETAGRVPDVPLAVQACWRQAKVRSDLVEGQELVGHFSASPASTPRRSSNSAAA